MLENGGRGISLQEAKDMAPKGEFLAYINKKEAKMLKNAGGSGIMTNAGIPSYNPNEDRAREEAGNRGNNRGGNNDDNRRQQNQLSSPKTTTAPKAPAAIPTGPNQRDNPYATTVDKSSDTQKYNHYETISRNTGVYNNPLRPSGIKPGYIKPGDIDGLNLSPYEQQRVDFLNTPYKPFNVPLGVPGGMLINTVGNFIGGKGANKNRQFFADNVAGKYGFGYDMNAYKDYMEQRMAGEIGAYGNVEQGQNALNGREGEGGGIMDVYNNTNNTDDGDVDGGDVDGDGDVDQTDDFIFKYFDKSGKTLQAGAEGVEDLMKRIRERLDNIFTT